MLVRPNTFQASIASLESTNTGNCVEMNKMSIPFTPNDLIDTRKKKWWQHQTLSRPSKPCRGKSSVESLLGEARRVVSANVEIGKLSHFQILSSSLNISMTPAYNRSRKKVGRLNHERHAIYRKIGDLWTDSNSQICCHEKDVRRCNKYPAVIQRVKNHFSESEDYWIFCLSNRSWSNETQGVTSLKKCVKCVLVELKWNVSIRFASIP